MKRLFLDTSYLIALEAADDQYHATASAHWQGLTRALPQLITTTYIFDEIVTFFNARNRHAKAMDLGNLLIESPSVELVHVDDSIFRDAWRYFGRCSDKSYSFTDCVSFVLMKQLRIRTALTFDRHFAQAGFDQEPGGL